MPFGNAPSLLRRAAVPLLALGIAGVAHGAGAEAELAEQNRQLQEQVREQQRVIAELSVRLADLAKASERHERELQGLRETAANITTPAEAPVRRYQRDKEVRVSGEVGLSFLSTGPAGAFPKSTFRVDDARIAVEAPLVRDGYFYGEIALGTREQQEPYLATGEVYLDFENVSGRLGGPDRLLNVRAGQFYTPFGEEYALRSPLANPLISHSLPDIWGLDAGLEAYGTAGGWSYAVALQNGSIDLLHDRNADKALAARIGWAPAGWLQLSASAMRTGELKAYADTAPGDGLSNLWIGNGFFRAIGPALRTTKFWAELWEADARATWRGGHVAAAFGGAHYDDNDQAADNARRLTFGYVEGVLEVTRELFLAARYSEIRAPQGYPLAGWGNLGRFFFSPQFATGLERLSLGFGYRLGPPLVLKFEYAWESGRQLSGAPRNQEDFLGAQAALKF